MFSIRSEKIARKVKSTDEEYLVEDPFGLFTPPASRIVADQSLV